MAFNSDAHEVHGIIKALVEGESAENWITGLADHNNSHTDFFALRTHYHGEGNANH